MGAVFLGEHTRLDRRVAIKLLRTELSDNQEVLNRFFTEARATSVIRHPNIVEVFDCDIDARGRAFIMMEFLEGETLAGLLARQGQLAGDLGGVVAIAIQATSALAAAHAKGIVHRDLKPENIMLTADGDGNLRVKIVDFGIAKLVGDSGLAAHSQTRTGSLMGTPLYMAPEQARGSGKIDGRSDIYSFGCILFAMLTGGPPFRHEGLGDLIMAHIGEPAPELQGRIPGLPPAFAALVRNCLAKAPTDRPQEMRAVERELREIARTVPAARLAVTIPVPAAVEPPRTPSAPPTPPPGGTLTPATTARLADPRTDRQNVTTFDSGRGQVGEATQVPVSSGQRWLQIAVPIGLVLAAGFFVLSRSKPDGAGARAPAVVPAPAAAPALPAEERIVTVQLRGLPLGAVISLDGEPAALPLRLPRGDRTYKVQAKAPAYADANLTVRATSDQELVVVMQPLPRAAAPDETAPKTKNKAKDKAQDKRAHSDKKDRSDDFRGFNDL
jgi:eukaryotic-like serine/threonine-protein kinase